ncbi:MAG: alpha/beta fold hydrolase [Thermoanaerobaculia bacterium]
MKRLLKWIFGLAAAAVLVGLTLVLVRAFDARRKPPLEPWHHALESEIRAEDLTETTTLADYLRLEQAVFREVNETVLPATTPEDRTIANRYWPDSPLNPERFPRNWNRTFELAPEGDLRGGVLLVHGLTDAPYSVKAVAEIYRGAGFYALCLRMPGHGTVPGSLTEVRWEDWRAAVRLGARHVRGRIGQTLPFHLTGYSNGGALAIQYALDSLGTASLPKPDRVVLLSPMIGVSAEAGFARIIASVGAIPYFAQSRWLDVLPEYIPFKYNSFPAYAAQQTSELTSEVQAGVRKAARSGRIRELPPILGFVSLVDSTVETWATIERLYAFLPDNGSELVLFDLNRRAFLRLFLGRDYGAAVRRLFENAGRTYRLSLVTNAGPETNDAVDVSAAKRSTRLTRTPLGLSWPPEIFSLSHVAVPFRPDDPLFGIRPDLSVNYGARLGTLAPRGERDVLTVSASQFMRLNCNPFFPYLEARVRRFVEQDGH